MKTEEEVYCKVAAVLEELFEIDPELIKPQASLYDDLDIDSIDAVDLVVELKKVTGKKMQPDDFKAVRTVQDIVDAVHALFNDS